MISVFSTGGEKEFSIAKILNVLYLAGMELSEEPNALPEYIFTIFFIRILRATASYYRKFPSA